MVTTTTLDAGAPLPWAFAWSAESAEKLFPLSYPRGDSPDTRARPPAAPMPASEGPTTPPTSMEREDLVVDASLATANVCSASARRVSMVPVPVPVPLVGTAANSLAYGLHASSMVNTSVVACRHGRAGGDDDDDDAEENDEDDDEAETATSLGFWEDDIIQGWGWGGGAFQALEGVL